MNTTYPTTAEGMIPQLSIVVLNWNVAALLEGCLSSLPSACGDLWARTEVLVVDNASTDNSVELVRERFPWAKLLVLPSNLGFTGGNNAGITASRGELIFLLNPDTVTHPGSIAALAEYMQNLPMVGIAGPALLNPDGTPQPSRRRFPNLSTALVESTPLQPLFEGSRILRDFYMLDQTDDQPQPVGWLSGAALMCRRTALLQAGLFDTGFFMFSEEVDLCRRVADAGWRVDYVPASRVTHFGGQSTGQAVAARHMNFNTSKIRYFRLHSGPVQARLLRAYLLGVFAGQMGMEAAKWILGHKRALRAERVKLYREAIGSGLREPRRARAASTLLITGEYPPAQGGVGDYTCRLQTALHAQGFPVKVLTRQRTEVPVITEGNSVAGAPLVAPRITLSSVLRACRGTGSKIVHIQYQTGAYEMRPTVNLLPLLLRGRWSGKSVVTFHDLRVPFLFPKAGPLREWTVRLLALGAHACIATNPEDAQRLRGWGIREVHSIPIGPNILCRPPESYSREEWRAAHGVPDESVLLAYFGFLNSTKGIQDLLHALRSLRAKGDYRLVMVGGGLGSSDPTNRATASELDRLAHELNVHDALIWTGYLAPPDVSAALLSADIAVLPYADGASFRRGSLLAVLEHGLPLVTTAPPQGAEHSGWPQLADGENTLLVPAGSVPALAAAVERLAGDAELQARLRVGAKSLAGFFGWDHIAGLHIALYSRLLGSGEERP